MYLWTLAYIGIIIGLFAAADFVDSFRPSGSTTTSSYNLSSYSSYGTAASSSGSDSDSDTSVNAYSFNYNNAAVQAGFNDADDFFDKLIAIMITFTVVSCLLPSIILIYWMCCKDDVYSRTLACLAPILVALSSIGYFLLPDGWVSGIITIVLEAYYFYVFYVYRL